MNNEGGIDLHIAEGPAKHHEAEAVMIGI